MSVRLEFWLLFGLIFIVMFLIDIYATDHRKGTIKLKTSIYWSVIWIITALVFAFMIYLGFPNGHIRALEYVTAYIIEKSLSVDNLFVFIMIFSVMGIKNENQPHILKWGIVGAVIFRIIFIILGVELINRFHFMIYIFGVIILYTAVKILIAHDKKISPERNIFVRLFKKFFPVDTSSDNRHFFVKDKLTGKKYLTIPFITLLLIESTDIIFAVDSIPAVLAISREPFIVITSNIFAILGLRALYFAIAGILNMFKYLKVGISIILFFVGLKMIFSSWIHIEIYYSLLIIVLSLAGSIIYSIIKEKKNK